MNGLMAARCSAALLFSAWASGIPRTALAQTAELRRNSNLRSEPSVRLAPLRLVTPGERVELASGEYRNGYYRVCRALAEEGWLWARNVRILSVSPGRSTTAYVLQPSNLRPVPSTSESPLGIIEPGSEVTILESQSVQGYFKVRTRSGEEGWLWAQNLGLYAPRSTLSEPPVSAVVPLTVLPTATGSPTPTSKRPGALALPSAAVAPGSDASRSGASAEASVQEQEAVPDHTPVAQDQGAQAKQQAAREYGLRPGMILDTSTAALAQGLLPPEIWQHYAAGKYRSRVVDYPTGNPNWEHSFVEETKENKQRLTVDERGSIIDKITGKMPDYLYGLPFPDIDPSDPNASVKVVWNYFLATWYLGNYHMRTRLVMMSAKGVEREVGAEAWALYRDGQPIKYRRENPMNFQVQFLGFAVSPADMQGTAFLYWRYRDPELRDSQWVFVPALRRVRAFAPANRSDGLMGSDISGDDGDFFDGKPQEFRWRLLEKREALRVVDPESLPPNALTPRPGRNGGWHQVVDRPPYYGYQIAHWPGLPWALPEGGVALRPMYLVEAVPRDRYYLYGRPVLWIDAETFVGAYHQKFDWKGEHILTYTVLGSVLHRTPDGKETVPMATQLWSVAENFKLRRASLAGARYDPRSPYDRRAEVDPTIFDPGSLVRLGK